MSQPTHMFETQNVHDDDGQIIDSFFIETDAPPVLKDATQPITPTPTENPKKIRRLLTGSVLMSSGVFGSPHQVLPADPNRKSVTLAVLSTAAAPNAYNEYVIVSDENGKVSAGSGFNLRGPDNPLIIPDYTGAIWAIPASSITASIELTWLAVTE